MSNCAKQRFVAASSRRTEEKVASRRGSGRHWRSASRARALSDSLLDRLVGDSGYGEQRRNWSVCVHASWFGLKICSASCV